MTDVDIPFNEWSEERLREGRKAATCRTSRYGDPGDSFSAAGRQWTLTHVLRVPLHVVKDHFYELEGCESPEEFVDVWEDIHYRRGYDPEWRVWLHLFRLDGDSDA